MKSLYKYTMIILLGSVLTSCFNDVPSLPETNGITSNYDIYGNVTFFKIYENITIEVSNQPIGRWDLAFQSALDGDIVLVNYNVSAKAVKTGEFDFSKVNKNAAENLLGSNPLLEWPFDDPAYSNIVDSTALNSWENGEVYLVYRGERTVAQEAYYKIQFISKTADTYTFRYAHIESTEEKEFTITRNADFANIYFSFEQNDIVTHEPPLSEWDYYLAPYYGWFETLTAGVYSPYLQTGSMINNEGGVRISQVFDESILYEDINLSMAEGLTFTDWKGAIGSKWKLTPNPENPVYNMDPDKKYVLKLNDGNYYKMRFTNFYNQIGEKGYPTMEIKLLE